jgi:hypothetical protein
MIGRGPWEQQAHLHRCPVPGCEAMINRLLCARHWNRCPRSLRDQLWRSWDSGRGQVGLQLQALAVLSATASEAARLL